MQTSSVPFKIDDAYAGFGEVEGVLALESTGLKLEFQARDNLIGVVKSGIKELIVPLDQIEEIGFKKSLFGNKLTVRVTSMSLFEALPGQSPTEVSLGIRRKHADNALALVSRIRLTMADEKYRAAWEEA